MYMHGLLACQDKHCEVVYILYLSTSAMQYAINPMNCKSFNFFPNAESTTRNWHKREKLIIAIVLDAGSDRRYSSAPLPIQSTLVSPQTCLQGANLIAMLRCRPHKLGT